MRLAYIAASPPDPSHFTVLVRSIPRTPEEPFDVTIINFFTKYHGSSYLSHQMIYRTGTVHKIMVRNITWLPLTPVPDNLLPCTRSSRSLFHLSHA